MSWSVTGATGLRLDPGNVTVTGLTSRPVAPTATTTYVLTATNSAGAVARSVTVTVTGAPGPTPTPGPAPTPFPVGGVDEFVGPFPSWKNVKDYGAVGNGSADDTDALQKGLDALSSDAIGAIKTLYLPAGTYRITNTLKLHNTIYVNLIGEDPDNTIIRWDPPSGAPSAGPMLYIDAVAYSRYNRLTFDGQGKASIAVDQSKSDDPTPNFDTGNEYAEDVFKNVGYGIRAGAHGFGAAESSVVRCRFINNSIAGVAVKNYNALDWWIWYSYFENCALGVTNNAEKGDAGNFNVYYSVFKGSTTADMSIANTGGFAIRNNYSIGSKVFFYAADAGQNGALTIIQGNTILDTTDAASIYLGNYGPVEIYDNIIRSKAGASGPAIKFGVAVDALALGNTFTVSNQISPATRLIADNSNTLQPAAIVAAAPVIPFKYVPSTPKRQIFEVPADSTDAAIQQQINLAASSCGQRPVVHLPATVSGKGYIINKSLEVPAGCDIQIVGDGGYSVLNWNGNDFDPVMILQGPSKAILRDFRVRGGGQSKGKGIVIENADQKNSRIYMQEAFANLALQNGLLVDGLENARVDLRSFVHQNVYTNSDCASVKVVGGQNNLGGRTNIIAGAASGNILSYQASQGGVLAVKDVWYETTGTKPGYIKLTDNSTVTFELGRVFTTPTGVTPPSIDIQNYNGRATFIGLDLEDRINISGSGAGSILALGLQGHSANYFFNNTGSTAKLINSR
ncbi:MAG TPA: glycosyl hydrolase family 28-related protein, partial [Blastocatellia bacterium]|nr:glycosyl hydrolase family 28-related protein [Blastocatellia bacterium]